MGILLGSAHGKVIIDASGVKTGTDQAKSGLESLAAKAKQVGTSLRNAGLALTLGLTLAIRGIGKAAVMMASDLEETGNKVQVVFGEMGDAVMEWSEASEQALGQSQTQALDAAASFGVFGKAAGLAGQDLVDFATANTELASDFASFWNTSPEEAILALGAAFRGETEPIRRYGVLLNQAAVQAKAVEMGLIGVNDELTTEARILATNALIWEQTTDAQGDFARTSEGLANQLRIAKAELAEVGVILGKELLPYVKEGVIHFRDLLKWFKALTPEGRKMVIVIGLIVAAIGPLLVILGTLITAVGTVAGALAGISLPVIAAVAAIVGAIILLKAAWDNNWGGMRDTLIAAWAAIQPYVMLLIDWVKTQIPVALQALAGYWRNVLWPAIQAVWAWMNTTLFPFLQKLAIFIGTALVLFISNLAAVWKNTLWPAILAVWAWMNTTLFPFLRALANFIGAVFSLVVRALAGIWQNVLWPAIQKVFNILKTNVLPIFQTVGDYLAKVFGPAIQAVAAWVGERLVGAFNSLSSILRSVTDWLNTIIEKLKEIELPSWMTPGSPTPWEMGLRGVRGELAALARMSLPKLTTSLSLMPAPAFAPTGAGGPLGGGGGGKADNRVVFYGPVTIKAENIRNRNDLLRELRG